MAHPPIIRAVIILLLAAAGIVAARQTSSADTLSTQLDSRVQAYSVSGTFVEALSRVAADFRIPIGISWVNRPISTTNLNMSWIGATVQEIIKELVATQPGYEFSVSNGIVHIAYTEIAPSQNFLAIKVEDFSVSHQVLPMAERNLQELARTTVSPIQRPTAAGSAHSSASNTDEAIVDLHLQQVSVEDVLDSLAKISASKIWVVTFEDSFILTSGGFRRTASLWSDSSVPDNEQPVWDTFRWGQALPSKLLHAK